MKLKIFRHIFLVIVASLFASTVDAWCTVDISKYVGWTIIYSGTVTGYVNEEGEQEDDFEGCDHDRILIIDNSKSVVCVSYGYSYAYRPDIVILWKQHEMDGETYDFYEACIDDEMYDIRMN